MRKNNEELKRHKENALSKINCYIDSLLDGSDADKSKADKLAYWIEDWTRFLEYEARFDSRKLRRYKRGEIIKVHLGFNVGSEEGGLHYAVVIDNVNNLSDPTVRVVPLTSVKPNKDVTKLPKGMIFLGNELFTNLSSKLSVTRRNINEKIAQAKDIINKPNILKKDYDEVTKKVSELEDEMRLLEAMYNEISKMKKGSIALVNQITTISKIRIYDPKTNKDILSNIKLSNEKLDLIDCEIKKLFTKNTL